MMINHNHMTQIIHINRCFVFILSRILIKDEINPSLRDIHSIYDIFPFREIHKRLRDDFRCLSGIFVIVYFIYEKHDLFSFIF